MNVMWKAMSKILGSLVVAAALLMIGEVSAAAGTTEIRWADFTATHQECQTQCTQQDWAWVYSCWTDGENQYCDWELQPTCIRYENVCSAVRTQLPDGDLINVSIQHHAADPSAVEFKLALGPGITWWKQITGSGGPDQWKVWNWDDGIYCNWPDPETRNCDTIGEWTSVLLSQAGQFVFSKAKFLGAHTDVYVLRNLASQLQGGDRVTFTWVKD